MRVATIMICALLAGCASHAENDEAKCRSMGFKPGTQSYGHCRLQLENNRAQARAVIGGVLLEKSLAPPPVYAPPARTPMNCSTQCFGTGVDRSCTTNCY
jgi:hypothetical protein